MNPQLSRAASLILSSLSFIHDQRNGLLQPDAVRDTPLDMSQYERLFGACRVPTDVSIEIEARLTCSEDAVCSCTMKADTSSLSEEDSFVSMPS